jgi:hypothetical protein
VDGGAVAGLSAEGGSLTNLLAAGTGDIGMERSASLAYNALPIDGGALGSLAAQGNALTESLTSGLGDISLTRNASLEYAVSPMRGAALDGLFGPGNDLTEGLSLPPIDYGLQERAPLAFPSGNAKRETVNFQAALGDNETSQKGEGPTVFNIQNLTLQSDDCERLLDIVRMIEHVVNRPQGVPA